MPPYNSNAANARHHAEWLSLLEISGPFLSMPILLRAFPQGLEMRDAAQAQELRAAYEEWLDNQQGLQADPALHRTWVEYVLADLLALGSDVLLPYDALDADEQASWSAMFPEHHETLRPDYVLMNPPRKGQSERSARLLVQVLPSERKPDQTPIGSTWAASSAARMQALLHATGVRMGLLTNGEEWMLVDAPQGQTTGYIRWYTELWFDEPVTLRAFTTLFGAYRFFGVPVADQLETLLAESVHNQQEVTDQLGHQVRRAVELLVQAVDGADQDEGRALLVDVTMPQLYEAAVTVMMRLVFLLNAEERGLLPLATNPLYAAHYAVATLHGQLRAGADQTGEEVLEHRRDAWVRLLATFTAVYRGVYHDRWEMPAYGGGLFDPTRFAFLAQPGLRINNRTVLHLLESLQYLEVAVPGGEKQSRRLSFRALDIEQIGHVYEGLLDHTAVRAPQPVVGLAGTSSKEPELPLHELETRRGDRAKLLVFLKEQTGRSDKALESALAMGAPDLLRANALRSACDNDDALYLRVLPWQGLVRDDDYGRPVIFPAGSVYVTAGAERRATGTHYTPRSLTEPIVQHTLEPLVYIGPAQGKPREEWALHTLDELLDLKVCDMAMGSGAFLVQACRYLSERVVEAYEQAVRLGQTKRMAATSPLAVLHAATEAEERLLLARRLVASRCLYGVDKNPLAVEMAKLSLWLITLDQGRPFTFLDHALKCGDSLVGVDLAQLRRWSLHAEVTAPMDALHIDVDIERMVRLRQEIEELPSLDIRDQEAKKLKLAQADAIAHDLKRAGDMLVSSYYNTLPKPQQERLRSALLSVVRTGASLDAEWYAHANLGSLQPFHWPLEFPEVILGEEVMQSRAYSLGRLTTAGTIYDDSVAYPRIGFDAFVGNPPFMYGTIATTTYGEPYMSLLRQLSPPWHGKADLVVGFFKRAANFLNTHGLLTLIATSSLIRGETLDSGLRVLVSEGYNIVGAKSPFIWPGSASVEVVVVSLSKTAVKSVWLNDAKVESIGLDLTETSLSHSEPVPLNGRCSVAAMLGAKLSSKNIPMSYTAFTARYPDGDSSEILKPTIGGDELSNLPDLAYSPRAFDPEAVLQAKASVLNHYGIDAGSVNDYKHAAPAKALHDALQDVRYAFACGETVVHLAFVQVLANNQILKHKLVVFPADSWANFAVLQSEFHVAWAWRWGLRREARLVYSPKRCAETFPLPDIFSKNLAVTGGSLARDFGEPLYEYRKRVMLERWEGLTATYNRFHKLDESAEDIARLRQLHVEMDNAVAAAYGWGDLDLGHGFHETQQGTRYTIAEAARRTVLTRLLELNHARYAEEVKAGLHDKKKGKGKAKGKSDVADAQLEMW